MDSEQLIAMRKGWRRFTFVEPPLFLILTAYGMTATVLADLIVFQTCRTIFTTNKTLCDILHKNTSSELAHDLDKIVQPHASYILSCQSLIEGILPALLTLFLGPWSDKYGRKPLLIYSYLSPVCRYILLCILSRWDLNPWFFMISSIPTALFSGSAGFMLATFCYITDITSVKNRAWHLAWLEGCLSAGLVLGTFVGPLIFQKFGYTVLFIIAATLSALSLLHIIFWIPETIQNGMDVKWGNPFDIKLVKEMILTTTKARPGLNRWTLWSGIVVLSLYVLIVNGGLNIGFLFANARLGWDTVRYSDFQSINISIAILGSIIGMKIMGNYIGFSDSTQAIIGTLSGFLTAIICAFTTKPWHMYLGMSVGVFVGIVSPTIRSILSKSAPAEDMGKVFSLTTTMESLVPLGGNYLYALIYSSYMPPIYPSPVYLLTAGIFFLILLLIILIERKTQRCELTYASIILED